MTPADFLKLIVDPGLAFLERHSGIVPTPQARVLLMAIAGQESDWEHRRQIGISQYYPQTVGARSYWQMESTWGGPVAINDVLLATPLQIGAVCKALDIPCDERSLYEACAWNDTLACALARLLLWQDPAPLPKVGDREEAWQYYLRNWKPGAPHRHTWGGCYDQSLAAMGAPT